MLIFIFFILTVHTVIADTGNNVTNKLQQEERSAVHEDDFNSDYPEPKESDVVEALKYGLDSMKQLYEEKEPKLYEMGIFLKKDNPAHFVAVFNEQNEEYKRLSKTAYAILEATKKFRKKFPSLSRQALKNTISNVLGEKCPRRGTPVCPPASRKYRTSDGSCNNLKQLWWGSAMSNMQRFLPAVYDDGVESIRKSVTGASLPSARLVSDIVHQERDSPSASVTHMLMQWGQFIDHDITATGISRAFQHSVVKCCLNDGVGFQPPEFTHPDCLPIEVHPEDSHLGEKGVRCLEFVRSGPSPQEDCEFGSREQLSQVTSYIDASTIYSSNAQQSDGLRIFRNGLLLYGKLTAKKPHNSDICLQGSLSTDCFKPGDGRLSEQPALISLHVVFVRLHNRLAKRLSAINPSWTDERIFQEARKIVGAVIQHITYREFLPIVLGQKVMQVFDLELVRKGYYNNYDPSVNPNIANAFSSAAYRFGHSLVQNSFVRFDRDHQPLLNNVTIHEEFANTINLHTPGSVDRILLGLINQPAQRRDESISEDLTNHLFQHHGCSFGQDLASINIQRGRDHGIAPFVDWRRVCALNPIKNWTDLERIMSAETVEKFKILYDAVEDIDLFTAGLAENPLSDGLVGPTFACIIAQQFRNLRRGDRFWYENAFPDSKLSLEQLTEIRKVSLAQILCATLENIESVQPFVMLSVDKLKNQRLQCNDSSLKFMNLNPWIENNRRSKSQSDRARRPEKPNKTRINQQNRVTVKRPLAPHENLTIVINNNAVYSPVFIRDSIYGSHQNVDHPTTSNTESPSPNPYHPASNTKPSNRPQYYPHNYGDPHSPDSPTYTHSDSSAWLSKLLTQPRHDTSAHQFDNQDRYNNDGEARKQFEDVTTVRQNWDSELPVPLDVANRR